MSAHNSTKFVCAVCKSRTVRRMDEWMKGFNTRKISRTILPYYESLKWIYPEQYGIFCFYCKSSQRAIEVPIRKKKK